LLVGKTARKGKGRLEIRRIFYSREYECEEVILGIIFVTRYWGGVRGGAGKTGEKVWGTGGLKG